MYVITCIWLLRLSRVLNAGGGAFLFPAFTIVIERMYVKSHVRTYVRILASIRDNYMRRCSLGRVLVPLMWISESGFMMESRP